MPMPLSRTQLETARLPQPPEPAKAIAPASAAAVTASLVLIEPKLPKPLTRSPHASPVVPRITASASHTITARMTTVCSLSTVW